MADWSQSRKPLNLFTYNASSVRGGWEWGLSYLGLELEGRGRHIRQAQEEESRPEGQYGDDGGVTEGQP